LILGERAVPVQRGPRYEAAARGSRIPA
jgi:hypothetical protein